MRSGIDVGDGSHPEELALSTTGPLYPRRADVRAISQQVGVGPNSEVVLGHRDIEFAPF
jgi:hypothetical protein